MIIDNYNLLYASIPAELVVQVPLCATDTEAEDTKNIGGVGGLAWRKKKECEQKATKKREFAYNLTRTLMTRWAMTVRRTARSRTRTRASGRQLLFFDGLSCLGGLSVGVGIGVHRLYEVQQEKSQRVATGGK